MGQETVMATEQRYDPGRGRFRLRPEDMLVLGQLVAGTPVDAELAPALAGLRAAGLTDGTDVLPDVTALIDAFARPDLVIDVETSSPWGTVGHGVAVAGERAWTMEGWPGTGLAEFVPTEPLLLVPALARLVGLRRSAYDTAVEPAELTAPLAAVEEALAALDAADPADPAAGRISVGAVLGRVTPAPDPAELAVLTAVIADRRCSWRVTASVPGGGAHAVRVLAVVDAGPSGLWRRTLPAEPLGPEPPGPDARLRLVRTTAGQVWRDLTTLLHVID